MPTAYHLNRALWLINFWIPSAWLSENISYRVHVYSVFNTLFPSLLVAQYQYSWLHSIMCLYMYNDMTWMYVYMYMKIIHEISLPLVVNHYEMLWWSHATRTMLCTLYFCCFDLSSRLVVYLSRLLVKFPLNSGRLSVAPWQWSPASDQMHCRWPSMPSLTR